MSKDHKKKKHPKGAAPGHPSAVAAFDGLNHMQSTFVREYLISNNASEAARLAGYKNPQSGNNLLNQPKVAKIIAEERSKRAKDLDITAKRVLEEVSYLAFSRLSDVLTFGPEGIKLRRSKELPDNVLAAINEVSETITGKSTTTKVKMYDKIGPLRDLMKHLGLFDQNDDDKKDKDPLDVLRQALLMSANSLSPAKQEDESDEEDQEEAEE